MHIIAIFIIAVCLIAIAYRDLKMALISLGAVLIAVLAFYFFGPKAPPDNTMLEVVTLSESTITRGYADSFVLNTRIHNAHENETLHKLVIRSSLSDCDESQQNCVLIGEEDNAVKIRVPASQAGDTRINLGIRQIKPIEGQALWSHSVIKVNLGQI